MDLAALERARAVGTEAAFAYQKRGFEPFTKERESSCQQSLREEQVTWRGQLATEEKGVSLGPSKYHAAEKATCAAYVATLQTWLG